jgi:hypothetical protein
MHSTEDSKSPLDAGSSRATGLRLLANLHGELSGFGRAHKLDE